MKDFRGRRIRIGRPIVWASHGGLKEGAVYDMKDGELFVVNDRGYVRKVDPKNTLMLLGVDYADL
jgi:hypothetical protein